MPKNWYVAPFCMPVNTAPSRRTSGCEACCSAHSASEQVRSDTRKEVESWTMRLSTGEARAEIACTTSEARIAH